MSDKKITKDYLEKQFSNFADKVSSVFAKGTELTEHIEDTDIHVTKEEKEAWDKKSEVEANPSLSGDEQALASVEVDGVKYKIVSGEGGSTVVPNPSMQGDETELQSIGIDGTNFKIVGSDASKIKILELNSPLNEQGILNVLKDNAGYLCSGFFYNTDVNVYCEFEGLYSGHIISGETVHFGYCHIKGIHNSTYSIDYAIDDEDGETWYSTVLDGTHVEANPTMEGTETSLNSIKIGDAKYKIPSGGDGKVISVNGKDGIVELDYDDVNAVGVADESEVKELPKVSDSSGEPDDSYEEVEIGRYDADGNMIFKRTFKGNTDTGNTISTELNFNQHQIYDIKGHIQLNGNMNVIPNFYANPSYFIYPYLTSSALVFEKGGNQHFSNADYTITVYYTYKSVN